MDFDGIRREARGTRDGLYEHLAEAIIEHLRRSAHGDTATQLTKRWRLAGYRFATGLLPMKKKRFPEELRAFMQGMTLSVQDYEAKHNAFMSEPFDVTACEKLEEKAEKLFSLAAHENTPPNEARTAAFGLVKLIRSSDMVLLSSPRVRHIAYRLSQMEHSFGLLRQDNPFLFLWSNRRESSG